MVNLVNKKSYSSLFKTMRPRVMMISYELYTYISITNVEFMNEKLCIFY